MTRIPPLFIAVFLLMTCLLLETPAHGDDGDAPPHPVLRQARQALQKALADTDAELAFEHPRDSQTLIVNYRT